MAFERATQYLAQKNLQQRRTSLDDIGDAILEGFQLANEVKRSQLTSMQLEQAEKNQRDDAIAAELIATHTDAAGEINYQDLLGKAADAGVEDLVSKSVTDINNVKRDAMLLQDSENKIEQQTRDQNAQMANMILGMKSGQERQEAFAVMAGENGWLDETTEDGLSDMGRVMIINGADGPDIESTMTNVLNLSNWGADQRRRDASAAKKSLTGDLTKATANLETVVGMYPADHPVVQAAKSDLKAAHQARNHQTMVQQLDRYKKDMGIKEDEANLILGVYDRLVAPLADTVAAENIQDVDNLQSAIGHIYYNMKQSANGGAVDPREFENKVNKMIEFNISKNTFSPNTAQWVVGAAPPGGVLTVGGEVAPVSKTNMELASDAEVRRIFEANAPKAER